jgi:hypothetical protein
MDATALSDHVTQTYSYLRWGIIIITVTFPFMLWGVGKWWYGLDIQPSMSDYYHAAASPEYKKCSEAYRELTSSRKKKGLSAPDLQKQQADFAARCVGQAHYGAGSMRNWFVGLLFAVGVLLILYKGFSPFENHMLNAAGVWAILAAIIPMSLWQESELFSAGWWHGFFAVAFFICVGLVAFFCGEETLDLIDDKNGQHKITRRMYQRTYLLAGLGMIAFPLVTLGAVKIFKNEQKGFWLEVAGIAGFALYWGFKTWELHRTIAPELAAAGKAKREQGKVARTSELSGS